MNITPEKQLKLKKYIRWGVILLAFIAAMFFFESPFAEETPKDTVGAISNCFFVPGVFFAGIGGLSYISFLGGYDSFGYAFSNFSLHNIFYKTPRKKYDSFYEYKIKKDKKGRSWLPEMLFTGLGSLGISLIIFIIYCIL